MDYSGTDISMEFHGLTGTPRMMQHLRSLLFSCLEWIVVNQSRQRICQTPTNALIVSDYREELVKVLSSARQCAAECIQNAQRKYKTQYGKRTKTSPNQYKIGDWVLIKHPQDETGANRKLSRPWYGPFRITRLESTGIIAEQI